MTVYFDRLRVLLYTTLEQCPHLWFVTPVAALGALVAVLWRKYSVYCYRLLTALKAVWELLKIPSHEVSGCVEAYEYLARNSSNTSRTNTQEETEMVRRYYSVVQTVLAVADIEKMYIPPQLDRREGVYGNQLRLERDMASVLRLTEKSKVLDIGCGRGRVAHHVASIAGCEVHGFNIDSRQVQHAKRFALDSGMAGRLHFKVGDFQKPFPYIGGTFDASYDMQAIFGFTKKNDLPRAAQEIYRTLKPGARFYSNTYALTPVFDRSNSEHMRLHNLYLPTLAATQSSYGFEIADALRGAGFEVLWSRPAAAPTWPLTDQKTALFHLLRNIVYALNWVRLVPNAWLRLIDNLLRGGGAWMEADKLKIADLCWQIVAVKPDLGESEDSS